MHRIESLANPLIPTEQRQINEETVCELLNNCLGRRKPHIVTCTGITSLREEQIATTTTTTSSLKRCTSNDRADELARGLFTHGPQWTGWAGEYWTDQIRDDSSFDTLSYKVKRDRHCRRSERQDTFGIHT